MPELPEVETVVRDLQPLLVGQRLVAVRVGKRKLRRPWCKAWSATIRGAQIVGIRRRGKWILLDLSTGGRLLVHLGMTGQFTVASASDPIVDHTHLVFTLEANACELRFRDVRRFGSVEWFANDNAIENVLAGKLGPEPGGLGSVEFFEAVRRSKRPLKAILLDQRVVAGVGNIYADESLHRARLHPERRGTTLKKDEVERLRSSIQQVIAEAIQQGGSTFDGMYVGGTGLPGRYQNDFRVYGRTGLPCPGCQKPIEVARIAGRSSHYCPGCQKINHKGTKYTKKTPDRKKRSVIQP